MKHKKHKPIVPAKAIPVAAGSGVSKPPHAGHAGSKASHGPAWQHKQQHHAHAGHTNGWSGNAAGGKQQAGAAYGKQSKQQQHGWNAKPQHAKKQGLNNAANGKPMAHKHAQQHATVQKPQQQNGKGAQHIVFDGAHAALPQKRKALTAAQHVSASPAAAAAAAGAAAASAAAAGTAEVAAAGPAKRQRRAPDSSANPRPAQQQAAAAKQLNDATTTAGAATAQAPQLAATKAAAPPAVSVPAAAAAAAAATAAAAASAPPRPKISPKGAATAAPIIGSNWAAIQARIKAEAASKPRRTRRPTKADAAAAAAAGGKEGPSKPIGSSTELTDVVALDCEMVECDGRDELARACLVNNEGNVLLDTFVMPKGKVTNYRTWVSGVRPTDLKGAPSLDEVAKKVAEMVSGRILVGHSITKDLQVLLLGHPRKDIRDTAKYPPLMFRRGGKKRPQALKVLAKVELGLTIQEGEHSPVDDARAALYLYHKHKKEWEKALRLGRVGGLPTMGQQARRNPGASYGKRDVKDDPMADL